MDFLVSLYERWLNLARWQKWVIIVFVGIFLFSTLYYVKVKPLKEELVRKETEVARLKLIVTRLKVVKKRKKKLEEEIGKLNKEIVKIESKLPTGKEEVSQILRSITDADSGMEILSIKRMSPKNRKYYTEYPYKVELKGNYPDFVKWCEKLSKANRIINFGTIEVKAIPLKEVEKEGNYRDTVKVKLDIKAFTLKR
ncbi:type 4a pilus biogenesis protein PilO [Thermovibrio sp.]